MNIRRLIGSLSFLFFLIGALLVCLVPGGVFNPWPVGYWHSAAGHWPGITLDQPGHIIGFVLLGIGAVGFVVLFSLNKPLPVARPVRRALDDGDELPPISTEPEGPPSPHVRR
jgi:hypothetical protein